MEPYVVRWGAAIPIRPGHWRQLLDKTAHLHEPPGYDPSCTEYILRSYYMSLQRSNGVFGFSNLDDEDARIERSGEFLCIQSGGKMRCSPFPSPATPQRWFPKVLRSIGKKLFSQPLEDYHSFVAMLAFLAPHLEDALIYVADEERALYRLVISNGHLEHTTEVTDRWCPLDSWPDAQLPEQER